MVVLVRIHVEHWHVTHSDIELFACPHIHVHLPGALKNSHLHYVARAVCADDSDCFNVHYQEEYQHPTKLPCYQAFYITDRCRQLPAPLLTATAS